MNKSEIYTRAAELVANRDEPYSCCAIAAALNFNGVGPHDDIPEIKWYVDTFAEEGELQKLFPFSETPRGRKMRVLALCFMAAIAEDHDLFA